MLFVLLGVIVVIFLLAGLFEYLWRDGSGIG